MKTSVRIKRLTQIAKTLTGTEDYECQVTVGFDSDFNNFRAQLIARRGDYEQSNVTYETFKVLDVNDGLGETYSKAVKDLYENVQILLTNAHHEMGEAGDEDACAC